MLLSPQVPPTRSRRSRSLVPGQLITLLQSESAPSLSSIALDLHVVSSNKVHRSSSDLPSNHLQDVRENEAAAVARNVQPSTPSKVSQVPGAWELQDTWEWYEKLPWLAGMNYLPRTAVNFVEMWDESTFDPQVIEEELRWAADKLGYNTLRTNLPMVLYEHDATGLTKRVNKFLRIAARCGFVVALVPLDDCEFSGRNPQAGKQPEPIPNLHNSQAIGSPGRKITSDPSQWFRVEEYIRYVVRTWGQDPRVFLLDLYNEPGNPWVFSPEGTIVVDNVEHYEICALQLMERVFTWAREEKPRQPLTVSAWHTDRIVPLSHPIDRRAMELSDVISIHAYCDHDCLQSTLQEITCHGKPILLTEWMARQVQLTYETSFPTLKELKVGAYQWGLVKGKTQTHLPWPHVAHQYHGDPMWWHDVLDVDGTFHDEREGEIIRSFVYPQNKALSSEIFLSAMDSSESIEMMARASQESMHVLLEHQNQHHLSQNDLSASPLDASHLPEGTSHAELPVILEGERQVIPSVCSISMATINALASQQAGEFASGIELDNLVKHQSLHSKSTPTFAAQKMVTPNMEGLDLAQLETSDFMGGIEF